VFDDRYAIPGAIGTDALMSAFRRVRRESHHPAPALVTIGEDSGDRCGPDGC
jgi:predicted DsbA family dithiol-disulfide isomerase